MGKLFSFTVTAQKTIGSDGCAARANYLLSETHENHVAAGTKILRVHGNAERVATNASLQSAEANKVKYEKGGRPNHTYGMEYMLSPPKGYKLTAEQGKKLVRDVLKAVAKKLDIEPSELAKISYSCIHSQDNDHLNIWFATRDNKGNNLYRHGLSRPSTTNAIRRTFNDFCLREYGLNIETFVPEKQSKAAKNWQRINDEKKIISEEKKEIDKRGKSLDLRETLIKKVEVDLKKKLPEQISKWLSYIELSRLDRVKSTENRIIKTLEENDDYVDSEVLSELKDKAREKKRDDFEERLDSIFKRKLK